MWLRNDQHEMYQADTLRKIRNGKVCLNFQHKEGCLKGRQSGGCWSRLPVVCVDLVTLRNDQHEMYQADTLREIRDG